MKKQTALTLALLAVILLAGCRAGQVEIRRNEGGGLNVTLNLTEADINTVIQNVLAGTENPLLRNPSVDLQDGQIVVSGQHQRRDGSGAVSGSFAMTMTAQQGVILAQVTALNIEGMSADDPLIQQINQRLSEGFSQRAARDNKAVTVQSVAITDEAVVIVFDAQRPNQ